MLIDILMAVKFVQTSNFLLNLNFDVEVKPKMILFKLQNDFAKKCM